MFIWGNIPVKRAGLLSSPARGKSKEEKQIFQWILWDEPGSWETRRALMSSPESLRPPGLAGHSERAPGCADPAAVGHEGRGPLGASTVTARAEMLQSRKEFAGWDAGWNLGFAQGLAGALPSLEQRAGISSSKTPSSSGLPTFLLLEKPPRS